MSRLWGLALCVAAVLFTAGDAGAFDYPRLSDGERVRLSDLAGRPKLLVVGTEEDAAPDCRVWMLSLLSNYKESTVAVFQIAVLNNPWYLPRPLVRARIRDFSPKEHYDRVLLEWKKKFAVDHRIPNDVLPTVLVLDALNREVMRVRGAMTDERLLKVMKRVDGLVANAGAKEVPTSPERPDPR